MSFDDLVTKRQDILRVAERHGARHVRVFGSFARGDANADSDVDLLVEFEPNRSLMDHAALVDELEQLLGRRVEVASQRGLKPRVRDRVFREARPL